MKKKTYYLILIITILGFFFGFGMHYYYAPPQKRSPYHITKRHDDTVHLAYIGDSWAYYHQPYDKQISNRLSSKLNHPATVSSLGFSGRSSKEIYWYMFDNPEMVSFLSKGYDYCFVALGINDANKKMSTNYYKQSMSHIIDFLLTNKITPIILEIPDYDIERMYRWEIPSRKLLRPFSMMVTGTPVNCKEEFRQSLNELIAEKNYSDIIHVIRYKSWNKNYSDDLKTLYCNDGIHLNEKGYAKLDSCIVEACAFLRYHSINHP